jgi:hypothetical protein
MRKSMGGVAWFIMKYLWQVNRLCLGMLIHLFITSLVPFQKKNLKNNFIGSVLYSLTRLVELNQM